MDSLNHDLSQVITEGKASMPEHPPPLVCKPQRVEPWRLVKIMKEFTDGFETIRRYGLAASFFGTSRASFEDAVYQHASELATRLSQKGFAIITGGAAGAMQAANKGAYESGGASGGLNIDLSNGQRYKQFLTDKLQFDHFFVRKTMLTYASEVYVYLPGGFGTLDEFFEILTLIQTDKIRKVPIILFGSDFWQPLLTYIDKMLYQERKTISREDTE